MSRINDGGPAFPTQLQDDRSQITCDAGPGMSLRDYFAGQALIGSLSKDISLENHTWVYNRANRAELARDCYEIADAMLEARSLPDNGGRS